MGFEVHPDDLDSYAAQVGRAAEDFQHAGRYAQQNGHVLPGRIGLREALRVGAYSDALGERIAEARREYEQPSPEEREQQRTAALGYLQAQREEIEQERQQQAARPGPGAAGHSGRDWRL
ncbi:hypothetical protein [Streptomyces sp. NPDC003710]